MRKMTAKAQNSTIGTFLFGGVMDQANDWQESKRTMYSSSYYYHY